MGRMEMFLQAMALFFCIEGIFFIVFPTQARLAMLEACAMSNHGLRCMGAYALIAAIVILLFLQLLR